MPSIILREKDKTKSPTPEYANFSVVVPGLYDTTKTVPFDENGIYECDSQKDFEDNIGLVEAKTYETGTGDNYKKYRINGNQIAYELLGLGYTVLYKKINIKNDAWDIAELDTDNYWEALKDRTAYDFRYIMLGGYNSSTAQNCIASLAAFKDANNSGRGDCIALIDIDDSIFAGETSQANAVTKIQTYAKLLTNVDKNTNIICPSVTYAAVESNKKDIYKDDKQFPASFHYLACASKAFTNYKEWFAVAGYTRGICDYTIKTTGYKFGDIAATTLAPRNPEETTKCVNLIVKEKNNYYIWGNRTAEAILSEGDNGGLKASHFLNIRQLLCTLKKRLYVICRQTSFDPNSDLLWVKFCNAIRPTLEEMKANEGISDYRILKVVNREKAKLTAIIRIVPIEAVEDFDITCYLEDDLSGSIAVETIEG